MTSDNYTSETTINKDIKQVFQFVADLKNLVYWTGAVEVKPVLESSGVVGSVYEVIFPTLLTKKVTPVEIVKYDFFNSFSFRDNSKKITFNYVFVGIEGETKVSLSCEPSNAPFAFSKLRMDKLLSNLKKYLETQELPLEEQKKEELL